MEPYLTHLQAPPSEQVESDDKVSSFVGRGVSPTLDMKVKKKTSDVEAENGDKGNHHNLSVKAIPSVIGYFITVLSSGRGDNRLGELRRGGGSCKH